MPPSLKLGYFLEFALWFFLEFALWFFLEFALWFFLEFALRFFLEFALWFFLEFALWFFLELALWFFLDFALRFFLEFALVFPRVCTVVFPRVCTVIFPRVCTVVFPRVCTAVFPRVCTAVFPRVCTAIFPRVCTMVFFYDFSLKYCGVLCFWGFAIQATTCQLPLASSCSSSSALFLPQLNTEKVDLIVHGKISFWLLFTTGSIFCPPPRGNTALSCVKMSVKFVFLCDDPYLLSHSELFILPVFPAIWSVNSVFAPESIV